METDVGVNRGHSDVVAAFLSDRELATEMSIAPGISRRRPFRRERRLLEHPPSEPTWSPPGAARAAVSASQAGPGRRAAIDFCGAFFGGSGRFEASHPGYGSNGGPNRPHFRGGRPRASRVPPPGGRPGFGASGQTAPVPARSGVRKCGVKLVF